MAEMSDPHTYSLYNRFVELMIVVGIDENTGLVPADKTQECDSDSLLMNLFFQEYEPHVLSAVSSSKATIFTPRLTEDPQYPPNFCGPTNHSLDGSGEHHWFRPRSRSHRSEEQNKRCFHQSHSMNRSISVRPALMKRHLSRRSHPVDCHNVTVPDLPLSEEVIRSVPVFCFPENAKIYRQKSESSVHFLVFTDLAGKKTYATCLTFYKPYILQKEEKTDALCLTLEVHKQQIDGTQTRAYLPQCCILISKYPYFYTMKECLSCMVDNIEKNLDEMFTIVKDFTFLLTMTPVPPPGNVAVVDMLVAIMIKLQTPQINQALVIDKKFCQFLSNKVEIHKLPVYDKKLMLFPSEEAERPVTDIPLNLVFLAFSINSILQIFTAILTEERIVFVSSSYALLTVIMESFINFIMPFSWRFSYVPILSSSSLELLEAPGTFMMGCHSKHLEVVQQVEGLVIVNIDDGEVNFNAEPSDNGDVVKFIPDIPREAGEVFKKKAKSLRYQSDLSDVQRPFCQNLEEERSYTTRKMQQLNREISLAFLELMVNLFRGVMNELKIELRKFNQEGFRETLAEDDKPFYDKVFQTDMFKSFLADRLNEKSDFWSDVEARSRAYVRRASAVVDQSLVTARRRSLRKQVSVSILSSPSVDKDFQIFELPPMTEASKFMNDCMKALSKSFERCDVENKASFLYLRGMFQAASENNHSAFEDFLGLHSSNARLVPTEYLSQLYKTISESEKEKLRNNHGSFIMDLSNELDMEEGALHNKKIWYENKVPLPQKDVGEDEFVDLISLLEIANDYDTIQRLFKALSVSDSGVNLVDQKTLENFVMSYSENQEHCAELRIENSKLHLDETIIKVSGLIKTDYGTGRIALTEKRLFFLKDVSNMYKDIVRLRDIRILEKLQIHSFLNKVDALVIRSKDFKFTAWLKGERNCWYMLIEEMRTGKVVSEATRDLTAIQQAATNVYLIDAVVRSGEEAGSARADQVSVRVESLCYYTKYVHEGRHNVPKDTREALQHRVDPNLGDRDRKTVESLLYTPGVNSNNEDGSLPPRLWCGMGDGKVKVFDASTWELENKMVSTKSTVACLTAVGETQIWVGSIGIYIIDAETITCNKILSEHKDLVTSIVVTDTKLYAYTASVGGQIISWEIQTLTAMRHIKLSNIVSLRSLKVISDQLWCGTWQCISVLDTLGRLIHSFQVVESNDEHRNTELDCFEITEKEVWAGFRREGLLVIWDKATGHQKKTITLECRGVSNLLLCQNKMWVGTKAGSIYIYETDSHLKWKTLLAHDDAVRSLCPADVRYIMSGAGSKDGKVAIWTPSAFENSGHHHPDNTD